MTNKNDKELLQEYVQFASEAAFEELVRRHVNMIYCTALRELRGDTASAEELTQLAFIELSRKAPELVLHPAPAGWLYTSVRWIAANLRRAEDRRHNRQTEYHAMSQTHPSESADATWQQVRPVLDETLHELDEADRSAIVLRFFEDLSLKKVGEQLGVSENAARMRVDRALEKLQGRLSRKGIVSTASALSVALLAGTAVSAPAGFAAGITAKALGAVASGSALNAQIAKSGLAAKKLILVSIVGALVVGAGSIHFVGTHRALFLRVHRWFIGR